MGAGLCCAQKGATEDAVGGDARVDATPRSLCVSVNEENEFADDYISKAIRYTDEEGTDLFFSARQSLSQTVNDLPYPPAATPKAGRSSNVTVDFPESMLANLSPRQQLHANDNDKDDDDAIDTSGDKEASETKSSSSFLKRPTEILTERLTEELMIEAGYPGELSQDELEACLEFRRRLKEHPDPTYRAMAYLNVDVDFDIEGGEKDNTNGAQETSATSNFAGRGPEEEAFALCRFLRARQFDVNNTFAMMDEHLDLFKQVLTNFDLHRSKTVVEDHIGCPLPVFTKHHPMIDYGIARNGAIVLYSKPGLICLQDGFDCINTTETPESFVERYMPMAWYITCRGFCETMHRLQKERESTNDGANFVVLAEGVVVVDLQGLRRDLFNKRTMEFIQQALGVIQCFPEFLNRVVVVNVPYFFTFIWTILKHFIDARTVQKIGFFSSLAAAQKELLSLVDPSQVLVEYGGEEGNPTFEEALDMKLKRDGDYERYVFHRYSSKTTKMPSGTDSVTLQTFSLDETEEAELTVYTQAKMDTVDGKSNSGARFVLLPEYSLPTAINTSETIKNRTEDGNRNSNSTISPPRFGQPAATIQEHSMVLGPGNYRLVVKISKGGPIIEKALLVVSIK